MILDHVEAAQRAACPIVYLGYWVAGSDKMDYKARSARWKLSGPSGLDPARRIAPRSPGRRAPAYRKSPL